MTIALPASPAPTTATPRPVDGGSWQQPIAGGTTIRIERPNADHMAMDVTIARLTMRQARIWLLRLVQGRRQPVRLSVPQPDIVVGAPGATVVDGGGQTGYALAIRGGTPGYTIQLGQALNIYDSAGRAYLHFSAADVAIGAGGKASVPVEPALRAFPADGTSCNLADPLIEGRLIGADRGITLKRALSDGLAFSIEELR